MLHEFCGCLFQDKQWLSPFLLPNPGAPNSHSFINTSENKDHWLFHTFKRIPGAIDIGCLTIIDEIYPRTVSTCCMRCSSPSKFSTATRIFLCVCQLWRRLKMLPYYYIDCAFLLKQSRTH